MENVFDINLSRNEFEDSLNKLSYKLKLYLQDDTISHSSREFENTTRIFLGEILEELGVIVDLSPPAQEFPDIIIQNFGIEVKFSDKNTWRSIANSIFEGSRKKGVEHIYLIFGKLGGVPEVRWNRYEDCVMHVRTSHVPRFEVEIGAKESLFSKLGIPYEKFRVLTPEEKMPFIRKYAKARLKNGERLWWIDGDTEERSLPLEVRLYTKLSKDEKIKCRAEAAFLCPQILKSGRTPGKYDDATMYLLTYHGILCNQARDLFSAGSVAMRSSSERGGIYISRAIKDIEEQIYNASLYLEDALFLEYWGEVPKKSQRIKSWLDLADKYAVGWKPSELLFLKK